MRKLKALMPAALALCILLASAPLAIAWEANGILPGTDVEYTNLTVTKRGVSVRLQNMDDYPVKLSLRLSFFDRSGNTLGYSLFGLREIRSGKYIEFTNNHLSGSWKPCRDAARMEWKCLTHEVIYSRDEF